MFLRTSDWNLNYPSRGEGHGRNRKTLPQTPTNPASWRARLWRLVAANTYQQTFAQHWIFRLNGGKRPGSVGCGGRSYRRGIDIDQVINTKCLTQNGLFDIRLLQWSGLVAGHGR
jgi:hypothetical protein